MKVWSETFNASLKVCLQTFNPPLKVCMQTCNLPLKVCMQSCRQTFNQIESLTANFQPKFQHHAHVSLIFESKTQIFQEKKWMESPYHGEKKTWIWPMNELKHVSHCNLSHSSRHFFLEEWSILQASRGLSPWTSWQWKW